MVTEGRGPRCKGMARCVHLPLSASSYKPFVETVIFDKGHYVVNLLIHWLVQLQLSQ